MLKTTHHNIEVGGRDGKQNTLTRSCGWLLVSNNPVKFCPPNLKKTFDMQVETNQNIHSHTSMQQHQVLQFTRRQGMRLCDWCHLCCQRPSTRNHYLIYRAQLPKSHPCYLQCLRLPGCFPLPRFKCVVCMGVSRQGQYKTTCNTHATYTQHTYNTARKKRSILSILAKSRPKCK